MSSTPLSSVFASVARTPTFSVQCDWEVVLREFTAALKPNASTPATNLPRESRQFWTTLNAADERDNLDAKVQLEPPASASSVAGSSLIATARSVVANSNGAFDLQFLGPLQLAAHHADSNTTQLVQAPRSTFSQLHPTGDIFTVDVNAAGTLGISGGIDGTVRTWDAATGLLAKELKGHKGDVYLARFFPSGVVALTGGLDLALRIWAVDTGLEAASLHGHTRPVTSVTFLERGRHLVTSSEDGTAKLWDVSRQAAIATYPNHAQIAPPKLNAAVLLDPTAHPLALNTDATTLPDLAQGNLLVTAGADGIVRGFDLRAQGQVFMLPTGSSGGNGVESLAGGPLQHTFTLGTAEGVVSVIELRKRQPLHILRQDDAAITAVRMWGSDSFWTTSSTGAANLWQLDASTTGGSIVAQMTGVDCEPIHDICMVGTNAYLASYNAVRVYALGSLPTKAASESFHGLVVPQQRTASTSTPAAVSASTNSSASVSNAVVAAPSSASNASTTAVSTHTATSTNATSNIVLDKIRCVFSVTYDNKARTVKIESDEPVCGIEPIKTAHLSIKLDGQCCFVDAEGVPRRRLDVRNGKTPPAEWRQTGEPDANGHTIGFVPIDPRTKDDKYMREAIDFDAKTMRVLNADLTTTRTVPLSELAGRTVEFIGPKVQGNLYQLAQHCFAVHGEVEATQALGGVRPPIESCAALRDFFRDQEQQHQRVFEGIVVRLADGTLYKVTRHHLGMVWPVAKLQ